MYGGGKHFPFKQAPNEVTGGIKHFLSAKIGLCLGNTNISLSIKGAALQGLKRKQVSLLLSSTNSDLLFPMCLQLSSPQAGRNWSDLWRQERGLLRAPTLTWLRDSELRVPEACAAPGKRTGLINGVLHACHSLSFSKKCP